MAKILTERQDIREWVEARGGAPIMMEMPDPTQGTRPLVQLSFHQHALNADGNEGADPMTPGFELVSWDDWFEAFESQDLAMAVDDDLSEGRQVDYRLMTRDEANTL